MLMLMVLLGKHRCSEWSRIKGGINSGCLWRLPLALAVSTQQSWQDDVYIMERCRACAIWVDTMDFGWACGRYTNDEIYLILPCWWNNATINCGGWNWQKAYAIGCIDGWPLGWDDQWLLGTSGRCEDGKTKGWLNGLIVGKSKARWAIRWLTA